MRRSPPPRASFGNWGPGGIRAVSLSAGLLVLREVMVPASQRGILGSQPASVQALSAVVVALGGLGGPLLWIELGHETRASRERDLRSKQQT